MDIRLQGMEKNKRKTAVTRSLELHKLLWDQTTLAVSQNPTMLSVLIIQSINQVIDMHETRITAAERNRIPDSIWFALYAITAFSMITIGSQAGLMKMRRLTQVIPAMLAFSAIITLVADLDLPSEMGHIGVSQEAMVDLQKNMISPSQ